MKKNLLKITFVLAVAIAFVSVSVKTFAQSRIPIYRLINPSTGKHLVAGLSEANSLVAVGWTNEGTLGYLASTGTIPVYRHYNSSNGDHYCSSSYASVDGYSLDGLIGYSALTGTAEYNVGVSTSYAVTSYYKNSGSLDHFYSRNPTAEMTGNTTYTYEGVAFYAYALAN